MSPERKSTIERWGLVIGFFVSVLLAMQLLEARFLQPIKACQQDQEVRIRLLESAIQRQTPVLEALGRRLDLTLPDK